MVAFNSSEPTISCCAAVFVSTGRAVRQRQSKPLLLISAISAIWKWGNNVYHNCVIVTDSSACIRACIYFNILRWRRKFNTKMRRITGILCQ